MTEIKKTKRTNKKFSQEEDARLRKLVNEYGESAWEEIAYQMKGRNPRQVHDRWVYYLSPKVSNAPWTEEDDEKLIQLTKDLNGKWVQIAKRFKGRNDTQIKNRWNILKKRMNLPDIPKKKNIESPKLEKVEEKGKQESTELAQSAQYKMLVDSALDKFVALFSSIDNENSVSTDFDFSQF